jgi:hypothetical protein
MNFIQIWKLFRLWILFKFEKKSDFDFIQTWKMFIFQILKIVHILNFIQNLKIVYISIFIQTWKLFIF